MGNKWTEIDPLLMGRLKDHAAAIRARYAQRDQDFEEYDRAYLMDWKKAGSDVYQEEGIQLITSPDARNFVKGAARLMLATDPIFRLTAHSKSKKSIEQIERSVNTAWIESGMVSGAPVHHDQVTSAVLYGEIHSAVTLTQDLLAHAQKAEERIKREGTDADKVYAAAQVRRAAQTYERTPFIVENFNPRGGYPEFDTHGLCAYYRTSEVTVADIKSRFGTLPPKLFSAKPYDTLTLHMFYDTVFSAWWLDSGDLLLEEHEYPEVPMMVQITDGTKLFPDAEDQREPLLYTMIKSGVWDKQSMALTAIMTAVFQMGVTPTIIHNQGASGGTLDEKIDFSQTPAVFEMEQGESVQAFLNKGIIDPATSEALNLLQIKGEESAIYKQALGGTVNGNMPYSSLALLSTSGRLPLVGTQTGGAWGISRTVHLALTMLKSSGRGYDKNGVKLSLESIPANLKVETKLDVKLPQDKLQQANIAQILYNSKMASLEWIQENILQIPDTEAMREQIWDEIAAQELLAITIQEIIMSEKAQPQNTGLTTDSNAAPPIDATAPPDMGAMMPTKPMQANPSMPPGQGEMIQGGLPPQQAGMIPGAGMAAAPPKGGV